MGVVDTFGHSAEASKIRHYFEKESVFEIKFQKSVIKIKVVKNNNDKKCATKKLERFK